jgi:N-acetylneuraminate synthase/N,N'-diacetyllegionaminate synthase
MLRQAFGVPAGWSDHTPGIAMPIAAVGLGATIVEKHLTLDRTRRGPDHAMSLEPAEFSVMVDAIRSVEAAIGGHAKTPSDAEREIAAVARRSLHWARDLPAGATIDAADLSALRPGTGISPAQTDAFVGRRTSRAVSGGAMVAPDDL